MASGIKELIWFWNILFKANLSQCYQVLWDNKSRQKRLLFSFLFLLFYHQITRKMRKSLASLGYTEQDIDRMTPSEASDKVSCGVQNSSQASGMKQVKTEDQSRDVKWHIISAKPWFKLFRGSHQILLQISYLNSFK